MKELFKIAVIDDEDGIIKSIQANLCPKYNIIGYTSSKEGLDALKEEVFDMLILDYFIDNMNGRQVVERIRKFNDEIYIMLLTGRAEEAPGLEILNTMDVQMYCEKSADFEKILIIIESAIKSIEHSRKDGSFGLRIKKLRKINNMSQDDLGKLLGLGRTAIANWEANQTEPTGENIKKLAEIFKVTTDYLLGFKANFS
ncbi:helix-turn-helix domain-containing protein [Pseudobacteroides cellulosolvens]|uniref:Stage 0 sporulation protein A homolog n=1 Tax=Pseudobacteroides cellulosolvens ATCC 35603 = DSM 2933 TaxID=398512 RepID=A0A0L6JK91_9FIRM|nr:helix-turn-helix domain-containing protein [Pseudobacteroides cellulosolvens]KNY25777.1 two component transcriptional regulator, XRE family [Pseudobacteroides cellulosolvens ATCC 35603 = DSM 2933]